MTRRMRRRRIPSKRDPQGGWHHLDGDGDNDDEDDDYNNDGDNGDYDDDVDIKC